jgi:hypothetical protein
MNEQRFIPWPLKNQETREYEPLHPIGKPLHPDGTVNYDYLDRGRWWDRKMTNGIGRGWVRDERFGSGQVIKGTNRAAQRNRK